MEYLKKSIKLDSKKGGIYIHSEANTKNAIKLHASNNIAGQLGHLQQIILQNDNGIFPESIHLNSLKGGIRLESGRNIGDAINLKSIRGGIFTRDISHNRCKRKNIWWSFI